MKQEYKDYMELLRSFVKEEDPVLSENPDLNAVLALAGSNATLGIAAYQLMKYPPVSSTPAKQAMRKMMFDEFGRYANRAEMMKLLVRKMNENGIDHLLFKGFIVRNYFPVPELRTFGDIDFVIRKEDRQKCHEMMLSLGYECKEDWEPVYTYYKGLELYEIHTDVMEIDVSDKADYVSYYSHIWEHTVNTSEHTYEFTPEFHFVYMLTHIAKHISTSGAGIRMYMDIAVFLNHFKDTLDWKWVQEQLAILKFEDFANVVLTVAEEYFGAKSPIELRAIDPEVMEDFIDFTLEGGVFGHNGRDAGTTFLKQNNRNDEKVSRFSTMMFHIFPPVSSLENRYTYLQKHHWLLPAAWVNRVFDNRKELDRYARNAKQIMTADTEEVVKLKKIYKEIGL